MPDDWSKAEVEAIVADYFVMWDMDLRGLDYNKAKHNRRLREIIPNRSRSSVEQKHRNISAVLWHLGYPYLRGYKPLPRYQALLRSVIEKRFSSEPSLNRGVAVAVSKPVVAVPAINNIKFIHVPPPPQKTVSALVKDGGQYKTNFVRRDYAEEETSNRSLGLAGEEFVLRFERERLYRGGKRALADKIEHVAKTRGDFLGYDIVSFEISGRERLIEVKTTRYGALNRFFASANEVKVSELHKDMYHLHRLFNFDKRPQFFVLSGPINRTCQLTPVNYSAVPI